MRVYDGENLKDTDPKAKSYQEYRDYAGVDEGMNGSRPASPSRSCRRSSTSTTARSPPTRCTCCTCSSSRSSGAVPARGRGALPRLHQGIPVAALRRVHRQGDPDRLPGVVFRVRAEHLRPLRHLRRLLDPGPGVPRPEHRRDVRPRRRSTRSWRRSRSRPASATRRTSATRSSTSCCARAPTTRARTRAGPATRSCAR
jgi:hypothetical protein